MLAALTVAGSLHLVLSRPSPRDVPVVVAVHQLAVGDQVGAQDVEVLLLPPRGQPDAALVDPSQAYGHQLVTPVGAGEILTTGALRTTGLLAGLPAGSVAVFVPLAEEAVARAATPGDLVDVHSPVDGTVVARQSLVLAAGQDEATGLWVAVTPGTAEALAAARGADPLGAAMQVALRPPGEQGHSP